MVGLAREGPELGGRRAARAAPIAATAAADSAALRAAARAARTTSARPGRAERWVGEIVIPLNH